MVLVQHLFTAYYVPRTLLVIQAQQKEYKRSCDLNLNLVGKP